MSISRKVVFIFSLGTEVVFETIHYLTFDDVELIKENVLSYLGEKELLPGVTKEVIFRESSDNQWEPISEEEYEW